ncbi:helix-turn-helix domain-containing protein [Clostridium beijerinckii]|uniref:helix-turn-helix domain-containing protein n=1 Tax=Clostridium beijerinckii TaxID=1520 RepID=UPI00098CE61D|nr:helix-turn-helix transcriptional regulator [Clostridium beijerinckii]NRT76269.1 transcriptional regulator with XRE-family HTH domain [Clostridium beijerinckii]OOM35659.1 helix-turn-helix protein [Clostridium beijerinckii]
MNKPSSLGKTIKFIRVANNIDRNKLSRLTGIDNLALYEIECGYIQTLNDSDIEKIANALGVSSDILKRKM